MTTVKRFNELINNTFEISQTKDGVKTVYVSGDDVKLYVNKHYGSAYCYYDNTNDLKADFDHFNRLHVTDFIRLLEALKFEYNPCENYDKYSDITVSHTGTIGTQSSSTMTSKINAFDNSSLVTDGETIGSGGNTTTLNNSDGTTEHTHGNVGVQTVSNMILQSGTGEAYLRFNSFVEHYLNRWVCGCIVGYGDEENEIEVSPSTEYATKTEFDALSNDVVNIADTVATHTESINTLDNSLGATISDVREVENDVQALDGVVNNLGSDVSNHETRIEALESAPTPQSNSVYHRGAWPNTTTTFTLNKGQIARIFIWWNAVGCGEVFINEGNQAILFWHGTYGGSIGNQPTISYNTSTKKVTITHSQNYSAYNISDIVA